VAGGLVELRDFPDEASAWVARAVLEAGGIASEVLVNHPFGDPLPKVRLVVRAADAEAAVRLLAESPDREG